MAKIVIIAPSDADVKDAAKLLKGDGHDVDIEEPTPKSLLHIVLGLLGPNAYGFGASYSVGSAAVPPSKEEEEPPEEDTPSEDSGADIADLGSDEDDFHFESVELGQVKVDGEVINAVSHDADHSVLVVTNMAVGPKTTYALNESVFSFWPADISTPMQRVDVGHEKWRTSLELAVQQGEKQELQVGRDLISIFETKKMFPTDKQFHRFTDWKAEAERLGYEIDNSGDGKLRAHLDGVEKGTWDPNYGGAGYGWFED